MAGIRAWTPDSFPGTTNWLLSASVRFLASIATFFFLLLTKAAHNYNYKHTVAYILRFSGWRGSRAAGVWGGCSTLASTRCFSLAAGKFCNFRDFAGTKRGFCDSFQNFRNGGHFFLGCCLRALYLQRIVCDFCQNFLILSTLVRCDRGWCLCCLRFPNRFFSVLPNLPDTKKLN